MRVFLRAYMWQVCECEETRKAVAVLSRVFFFISAGISAIIGAFLNFPGYVLTVQVKTAVKRQNGLFGEEAPLPINLRPRES